MFSSNLASFALPISHCLETGKMAIIWLEFLNHQKASISHSFINIDIFLNFLNSNLLLSMEFQKSYFIIFFSFLLIFLICIISSPHDSQTSHFYSLPKRILQTPSNGPPIIGYLDTFAYDPKFLKIEIFDVIVKDEMIVTCFMNGTCTFAQKIVIDEIAPYYPRVETLNAPKLPQIWNALSLINVLVLKNSDIFSNQMKYAMIDLKKIVKGLKNDTEQVNVKIQDFFAQIQLMIQDQLANVQQELILDLNDTNSDLSLE